MSLSEEIERLQQLHESGALTAEEFAQAKAALLNDSSQQHGGHSGVNPDSLKWWAMALHLSQFAGMPSRWRGSWSRS